MKKPETQNAFTPGLFKIDMSAFKRSTAGAVGGAARAKSSKGGCRAAVEYKER
jgi:hypothetical protein